MGVKVAFLAAYACSGLAGLVYEVSWTRLLTLYMGHTTAAASAVIAAFMGGLAAGAAVGGLLASKLTPRQSLLAYIALEGVVALAALSLPFELSALTSVLRWAYRDGDPGALFPLVRLALCLVLLFLPAAALGATFPVGVRWFLSTQSNVGRAGGALYAVNTVGAAVGALIAGFVLIPSIGVSGTTRVGLAATTIAMLTVAAILWRVKNDPPHISPDVGRVLLDPASKRSKKRRTKASASLPAVATESTWLAACVLGLSGFASLMYQIAWTRVLALTIGPTTYALAATLTAFIGGLAIGSGAGAVAAGRSRRPAFWLVVVLGAAAIATTVTASLAGGWVPRFVASHVAGAADEAGLMVSRNALLVAALVVPATIGFGAAFPLALATIGAASGEAARRVGLVYATNAIACVGGALAAGFLVIPSLGLQRTLQLVGVILMAAVLLIVYWGTLKVRVRVAGFLACTAVTAVIVSGPPWDRELLASGVYKYAHFVAENVDLEEALKAGTLLYYGEGAAATVSVKRLTGTLAMAIDGKVDASNGSDMLNQKMAAHLPLLLHERPRDVGIIGLGSGVTLASALVHPIERADVIEISPEVVEASKFFAAENRNALDDPRARLIVGDGRSHLALSNRTYDVLISEPSNPWIAGVAALFTREFFLAARSRLAPGGIICQWAHTYNITDRDLRSIVATFTSVFPNGTAWLIGQDDVLMVAGEEPLDARLGHIESAWKRPGVADDLRGVAAASPFAVWSTFVAGPAELKRYANGAPLQTDDRMALEFTGPRGMNVVGDENATKLAALLAAQGGPPFIQRIRDSATAADWRSRGAMLLASEMYGSAYEAYARAAALDPTDVEAVEGFVRSARMSGQMAPALDRVKSLAAAHRRSAPLGIAESKLLAASGEMDKAVEAAKEVRADHPSAFVGLEQHASLLATIGDADGLEAVVADLRRVAPARAATAYYAAVARLLRDDFKGAVESATRAVALDPAYAATYDLLGAARVKLGEAAGAREAFETSLRYNRRDSTAYANLGILELEASNPKGAAGYFAEALWLDPESAVARQGLAQARSRR